MTYIHIMMTYIRSYRDINFHDIRHKNFYIVAALATSYGYAISKNFEFEKEVGITIKVRKQVAM